MRIEFIIEQDGYTYADCITLTDAEYESLTVEQIEAMKQARFDAFLALVEGGE